MRPRWILNATRCLALEHISNQQPHYLYYPICQNSFPSTEKLFQRDNDEDTTDY